MINDVSRNQFYDRMFQNTVNGKHCVDFGFGNGLLSILALKHGATHVSAFEMNPDRYELGKYIIKQLSLENQITLFNQKFDNQMIETKFDLLVHEVIGKDLWDENLYCSFNKKIPMYPNIYTTDIYAVEISEEEYKYHQLNEYGVNDKFENFYQAVKIAEWPDCKTIDDFELLPDWIKSECIDDHNMYYLLFGSAPNSKQKFNPGIDIDARFVQEINHLIHDFFSNNTIVKSVVISRKTMLSRGAKKVASITHDHNDPTIDLSKNCAEVLIPVATLRNKRILFFPVYTVGYKNDELCLSSGTHWPEHTTQALITNNLKSDLCIRQNLYSGKISSYAIL